MSYNFMAAVTTHSDFGVQENKIFFFLRQTERGKSILPPSMEIIWGTEQMVLPSSLPGTGKTAPTQESLQRPFQRHGGADLMTTHQDFW